DRDLADVFAIQSEIAKTIADQLQAKLSPNEKSEIEQPPTTDVIAFDFYSHAKNLLLNASGSSTGKPDLLQAADLLNQAVARDPSFLKRIANSPSPKPVFISSTSIGRRRAWRQPRRLFKRQLVSGPTLVKRTSHARAISIG